MYLSEHFGRAFWVDSNNEFKSCPLFVNNKPDYSQADYVSEWTDLEGVSLDKLLYIHRFELLLSEKFRDKVVNSDFILTDDVYKMFFKSILESNLGHKKQIDVVINSLLQEIK